MNRDTYGFSLSFLVHGVVLGTILHVFPALDLQPKPVVIDFSLISGSSSRNISAAVPQKNEPAKPPPIIKAPPKPRQLALPKPIERVVAKVPPEPVIAKKILTRPVEKILPQKEEKVEYQEFLSEAAEISTPVESQTRSEETGTTAVDRRSAGGPAGPVSNEALEQQYVRAHFIYIKKIIEKNISYPPMARRMGWQGKVVVSFIVCQDGKVENLEIVESSGHAQLDKNALQTVRQVEPFPGPPVRVRLVLPVNYKIS